MRRESEMGNRESSRQRLWRLTVLAVAILFLGLALGFWLGRRPPDGMASSSSTPSGERKVLYWYDPMAPEQRFDKPGKSPYMDMQLLPRYANEVEADGVSIAPGTQHNLGIRTVEVERGRIGGALTVPGTIGWDLTREYVVSVPVEAVVNRLYVKTPFEFVHAGQPLVSVLAPVWSTALAEAQAVRQAQSSSARSLGSAAQARLHVLGLPPGARVDRGGIALTSPVRGVVSEIGVREGQAAPAGTLLFRVNGSQTVWLEAAVPQTDTAGIRAGTPVEAQVSALPGEVFSGRIDTLLPSIDLSNRTQQARIVLDNPDGRMAPGMFAQITLQPEAGADVPLVPTDAVIGAGDQARVIVRDGQGRFVPVAVQTGRSGGGHTEILRGLKGGERVVASGQFLIDSEASLSGALDRLGATEASVDAERKGMKEMGSGAALQEEKKAKSLDDQPAAVVERTRLRGNDEQKQKQKPAPASRRCQVQYWYDPMMPGKHFDEPGKSPFMDMQLVPKFAPDSDPACTIRDVAEPQP
jgi:Cu(I)/Ag(I) efflux system membrane fusion protein